MKSVITQYVNLTKPTIVLLFAITGLTAMVIERSLLAQPLRFWAVLIGITLTAASANALNMYFDRDIDEIMPRTKRKRPIPMKTLSPQKALNFGIVIGIISMTLLAYFGNPLAAFLGFATIFFYIAIYTLFLKRRTTYNIVIGGAAGATAPLIGWAAATGNIAWTPAIVSWLLFLIIFMWTPPHFWALALVIKEDYRKAKVPMLPVVHGDRRTKIEIFIYTIAMVALTLLPPLTRMGGALYTWTAAVTGLGFIYLSAKLLRTDSDKMAYGVFGYSIVYLLLLFIVLIAGALITGA